MRPPASSASCAIAPWPPARRPSPRSAASLSSRTRSTSFRRVPPDAERLRAEEAALAAFLQELAAAEGVTISTERLARFEPVTFDARIVEIIEQAAVRRGLASKRMTSGAGHDAEMIARIAPAAMIFVPSVGGISHNPLEYTPDDDLIAGANVLLDVVKSLASAG
ncbi:M20/M25/M40 family metallo-hydrolase [Sinorhizobium fredii]|uniref:M20/M25/M40 family metallo-hydrolase n=1 Tax=Rhizobium fredii TaxID=380 RepID=UPI00244E2D8D|nr:M20/M25/M40 family metallo-hydrolase [Sinorhizobium fredii]WOS64612.1 M20/M25/M40 family metallo-hydrolase [Sinorhizobium fredii GR64]